MKIQIISDLHIEFGEFDIPIVDRDVLVIAGDFNSARQGLDIIKKQCQHSPVILVLGNHDFYNDSINEVCDFWEKQNINNFHFLNNDNVVIDDVNFIGSTLFPDFLNGNPTSMIACQQNIADFNQIYRNSQHDTHIKPGDYMALSIRDKEYVKKTLNESTLEKNVVVTHFLPSDKSIDSIYKERTNSMLLNGAFLADIEPFIQYCQPDLMIHGHTHCSLDYYIGKTRIVCNPRGYYDIGKSNKNFNSVKVVTI